MLHEHESVHIKFARFQEDEFVLQTFLHLCLVISTKPSGTGEFDINSSLNFKPSICNTFPFGDGKFSTGIHADFQINV